MFENKSMTEFPLTGRKGKHY